MKIFSIGFNNGIKKYNSISNTNKGSNFSCKQTLMTDTVHFGKKTEVPKSVLAAENRVSKLDLQAKELALQVDDKIEEIIFDVQDVQKQAKEHYEHMQALLEECKFYVQEREENLSGSQIKVKRENDVPVLIHIDEDGKISQIQEGTGDNINNLFYEDDEPVLYAQGVVQKNNSISFSKKFTFIEGFCVEYAEDYLQSNDMKSTKKEITFSDNIYYSEGNKSCNGNVEVLKRYRINNDGTLYEKGIKILKEGIKKVEFALNSSQGVPIQYCKGIEYFSDGDKNIAEMVDFDMLGQVERYGWSVYADSENNVLTRMLLAYNKGEPRRYLCSYTSEDGKKRQEDFIKIKNEWYNADNLTKGQILVDGLQDIYEPFS